jgi:hypothetical protein
MNDPETKNCVPCVDEAINIRITILYSTTIILNIILGYILILDLIKTVNTCYNQQIKEKEEDEEKEEEIELTLKSK